ncbi:uncharacterized protein LOC130712797 [Lotus japonicus]|uniref:uncharacterized protein LOC130712797 n=1 Tax=Lotus japonicus TaxID=34305 RepID=UPI00258C1037|nr:uncharacterized protein LOC130712797 [Lotus japonicus]
MTSNGPESVEPEEVPPPQVQKPGRQKSDVAWAHCYVATEDGKSVLICLYCNKNIKGGGINRMKAHLARESGQITGCPNVPDEVRVKMKESIDECQGKKRKAEQEYKESNSIDEHSMTPDEEVTMPRPPPSKSQKGKDTGRISAFFVPRTTPGAQPTLKSVLQSKEIVEKCDLAISRWMIDASVPFNAVNSAYFQPMIDAVCAMGSGYKAPNFHRVRGFLLNKWVDDTKKLVESYREVWKRTGCTLMADGWTDRCRRSLINFLVYCPKGTVFLKSVDASQYAKTAEMLFKLFKEVILYIGPENVVQVVTDNAANYVAAGRLLEAEFPKLYWSPCAAHCVNLMFQDIGKLEEVAETVSQASNITKYIYNHCFALSLMRKHTNNREILRPAPTRFATNFIALQSILAQMEALRAMVVDKAWTTSTYARDTKAKKFVEQVLDSGFWKKCADIVKLTEPLVKLLRLVDSEDKPAMGFLYQAFYKTREEMVKRFQRNKKKVEPYLKIIDSRWDSQLRKNLHAACYWLNPGCRFNRDEFEKHESTISGLLDVIDRYSSGDIELNDRLTSEKRLFKDAELDFGRKSAIRERSKVMPGKKLVIYT